MQEYTDQMGHTIRLRQTPQRIVSLVPSQTELLYDLGLTDEVVGQTLFCIHPKEQHENKPRVGGTKKLQLDKIRVLKPDLILGNKEENDQSQIAELQKEFEVWMSDIKNLNEALQMITTIGEMINRQEQAAVLSQSIETDFAGLHKTDSSATLKVLYLIWRQPYMAAGTNTFISDMITRIGWQNALTQNRYPELTPEQIALLDPDIILLSSEPYPFKNEHIAELKMICPGAHIRLADGEMFSWYGSRLLKAASYFRELKEEMLHP
ncbi:MAG: ABC transporter substrate-binding protein [Bacteroidia bacterium]|nr:ABC transporter substrate-binding protein [Bacteroidia bacterium]